MSYATAEDFVDAFGLREARMIADKNLDGEPDTEVINRALDTATMQINAAIGQRCPLPLPEPVSAEVMGVLKQWCLDIARYRLTGSSGTVVSDDVDARYKEAKADLDRVIAGKLLMCKSGAVGSDGQGGLAADSGKGALVYHGANQRRLKIGGFTSLV